MPADPGATSESAPGPGPKDAGEANPTLAIGQECKQASECVSGFCEKVTLRGRGKAREATVCSECAASSDCPSERPHCTYDLKAKAKSCGSGDLGQTCNDNAQCGEQVQCAKINLGDNDIPLMTCSECEFHTDCTDESKPLCISLPNADKKRFNQCAAHESRKNGDICFPCETGDDECEGFCVNVNIPKKNFCVGVCGECRTDADCASGEICSKPELKMGSDGSRANVPSKCVAKG